jgi:CRP-like cAMP-binding protein
MDKNEMMLLLKKAPLFSRVNKQGLEAILNVAQEMTFPAKTKIVSKGVTGLGFYLILKGSVEVSHAGEQIATLKAGTFFGEMALLDKEPRSADVIALEDTKCLALRKWDLKTIIERDPEVALAMLEELARRLRKTGETLS